MATFNFPATVCRPFLLVVLVFTIGFAREGNAQAKPKRVSPTSFGRVFAQNRSALVRVKARTDREVWTTGFIVGARGEVVFGIDRSPTADLTVTTEDGRRFSARLLGFDRELSLAVGIADGLTGVPLRAGAPPPLVKESWVVILGHDDKGRPKPHAGVVARPPQRRSENGHVHAVVEVPGKPGSPILSPAGQLVGIAVTTGKRRTRMVPLAYVTPFLERVVLGGRGP